MSKDNRDKEVRKQRIPLGGQRTRLTVPESMVKKYCEKYHLHWINDSPPGHILEAQNAGYTFLEDTSLQVGAETGRDNNQNIGGRVSRVVGVTDNGASITAYLMKIPLQFYKEDRGSQESNIKEMESGMCKGVVPGADNSHQYAPEGGGVKIQHNTG